MKNVASEERHLELPEAANFFGANFGWIFEHFERLVLKMTFRPFRGAVFVYS